ncbi:MAG: hypothetical protein HQM02_09630 [Magnetococcales bacterium]|nr:hypothetical protein [Magnetococcales bacterium]
MPNRFPTPPPAHGASVEQSFLVAAGAHLALTGAAILHQGEGLFPLPLNPGLVATVHLFVLGVVTLALMGIGYRLLPHWSGLPVPWPALIPWTLGSLIVGALSVYLGIGTSLHRWFLLSASAGVGLGCGFFLLQCGLSLLRAPRAHPALPLARIAHLSLAGVLALGATFLGEYAHGFLPYDRLAMVGTHLTWGLFGWAGTLLFLARISLLTGHFNDWNSRIPTLVLTGIPASLLLVPAGLFLLPDEPRWLWLTTLPGGASLIFLTASARKLGVNPYWNLGDLTGVAALAVLLSWPLQPEPSWRLLFGALWLPGWCLSQLFGLYAVWRPGRLGRLHLACHTAALALLVSATFAGWGGLAVPAGGMLLLSALLFLRALRLEPVHA